MSSTSKILTVDPNELRWITGKIPDIKPIDPALSANSDEIYELQERVELQINSRYSVYVLPGLKYDLNSLPSWSTGLLGRPDDPRTIAPATIHDDGYEHHAIRVRDLIVPQSIQVQIKQKDIDRIYLHALKLNGVPTWNARTRYYGLKVGGWVAWDRGVPHDFEALKVRVAGLKLAQLNDNAKSIR